MINKLKKAIVWVVISTFLWSNLVWGGVEYFKLSAPTQVHAIVPVAGAFVTGQEAVSRFARSGIRTKGEFYRKIEEELKRGRVEELAGVRCLVFSDQNDPSKLTYYVFNPKESYFSRITTHTEVNDSFWRVRQEFSDIFGYSLSSEKLEFHVNGNTYYQQVFAIDDSELDFINTCINKIYPGEKIGVFTKEDQQRDAESDVLATSTSEDQSKEKPRLHLFPRYIVEAIELTIINIDAFAQAADPGLANRFREIINGVARYDIFAGEPLIKKDLLNLVGSELGRILGKDVAEDDVYKVLLLHEQKEGQIIESGGDKFIAPLMEELKRYYAEQMGKSPDDLAVTSAVNNLLCGFARNYNYLAEKHFPQLLTENYRLSTEFQLQLLRELLVHIIVEKEIFDQPVRTLPVGYKDARVDRVSVDEGIVSLLNNFAKLNGLVSITQAEAYTSREFFSAYIPQRIGEKLGSKIREVERLIERWRQRKKVYDERAKEFGKESIPAKDAERMLKLIENEINMILDEENAFTDSIEKIEFADALSVNDFIKDGEYDLWRERVEQLLLEGGYVPEFFFAGAATRMGKGTMYGLDLYEVAKELGIELSDEAISGLGLGVRQVLQYRLLLERMAREKGVNPIDILGKAKLVIHTNVAIEDSKDSIARDFIRHNFYGFRPENVIFLIQDVSKGHKILDGRLVLAEESIELPIGHGYSTMQLAHPGQGFVIESDGRRRYLEESVIDYLLGKGAQVMSAHRINDATKWTDEIVEIDKLAYTLRLFAGGFNVVIPLTGNPKNQKGGQMVRFKGGQAKFLLEKLNAQTPQLLPFWGLVKNPPFNPMRNIYDLNNLSAILQEGLPVHLRFRNGYLYVENATGDLTQLEAARTEAVVREGEVIHDIKTLGNVEEGVSYCARQDENSGFREIVAGDMEDTLRWFMNTGKTDLTEKKIRQVGEAYRKGKLRLTSEYVDVIYVDSKGVEEVIGKVDRGIAHRAGLLHRTTNAFIISPDGKVILQRRAPHKEEYPLNLSIYGGHVPAGKGYLKAIRDIIRDEMRLPSQWKLQGGFKVIGEEGGHIYSETTPDGGMNNERRSLYLYFPTDEEYRMLRDGMRELEAVKYVSSGIEEVTDRLKKEGIRGEVWSIHEYFISEIREKAGKKVKDKFSPGLARFTKDLLKGLAADSELMDAVERIISIGQLSRPREDKEGFELLEEILMFYRSNMRLRDILIGELKKDSCNIPLKDMWLYMLKQAILHPEKNARELFNDYFESNRDKLNGLMEMGMPRQSIILERAEKLLEISKFLQWWGFRSLKGLPYVYDVDDDRSFDIKLLVGKRYGFRLLGSHSRDKRPGVAETRQKRCAHSIYDERRDNLASYGENYPERIILEYKTESFGKTVKSWVSANPFPIFKNHIQLVLQENKRQKIDLDFLRSALGFIKEMKGLTGYFNSIGAGGTQNHPQIELFPDEDESNMPIDNIRTEELFTKAGVKVSTIRKDNDFPVSGFVFEAKDEEDTTLDNLAIMVQSLIEDMMIRNIPYNIIFRRGKIYVIPRNFVEAGEFGRSFAGVEMIGYLLLTAGELLYTPWVKDHPDVMTEELFNRIQKEIEEGVSVDENRRRLEEYIEQAVRHMSLADISEAYKKVCLDANSVGFRILKRDIERIAEVMEMKNSPRREVIREIQKEGFFFMMILLRTILDSVKEPALYHRINYLLERRELEFAYKQLELDIGILKQEIEELNDRITLSIGIEERERLRRIYAEKVDDLDELKLLLGQVKEKYSLDIPVEDVVEGELREIVGGNIRRDVYSPIGKEASGTYEELWEADLVDSELSEGVSVGIGEGHSKYGKIDSSLLKKKLDELVSVFGPGILAVVDAIRVVDNIGVSSLPERQAFGTGKSQVPSNLVPYAMMIKKDGRNILLLDVDAFDSEEILYIILEHELKESIMTVIPCENEAVREFTTNFMSLKLALERGIKFDKDQLEKLGADMQFYDVLEALRAMVEAGEEIGDRDIMAVALEHMRGMDYYREFFQQFKFTGEWESKVIAAENRYRAAIDVFNEIMEAKLGIDTARQEELQEELKKVVEEVEINVKVIKTFTGKMRVVGLEGLSRILQGMIGVVAKQIHSVDRFSQQITEASSMKYILVSEKRLKELKDAIGEEEYERIRKELEDNNYQIRTRKPHGVERKDVIRLVDPVDLRGMRKLQDVLYLPMPYTRSSLYMAANIVQAGDEVSSGNLDNVDSLVKAFIRGLYSQIIGGEVSDSDLVKLFNTPWDFLPKIRRVIDDLNSLREAILQIEKAA